MTDPQRMLVRKISAAVDDNEQKQIKERAEQKAAASSIFDNLGPKAGRVISSFGDTVEELITGNPVQTINNPPAPSKTQGVEPPAFRSLEQPIQPYGEPPNLERNENRPEWTGLGMYMGGTRHDRATAESQAPTTVAPPVLTDDDRLKAFMARFGSGGGGMYARLNDDQTGGYKEQRAADLSMLQPIENETENKRAARVGMQDLGAKYVTDLGAAQVKQQAMMDQRKAAIAEESRANKEAEGSFDSMRLTRKLGENPISSAVMSFAAGLVGSLKGAAGDTSPNMVLGEVDKAVERDVMNQKVQYERMRNGQESARTNFTDEMKMGETEQSALLKTTAASMDQHVRALEYASARIADAKLKASVLGAAGALRSQYGELRYKMDVQKAHAANAATAQNQALMLRFYEAQQQAGKANPEAMMKAYAEYAKIDKWQATLATTNALATVAKTLRSATPNDLDVVFGSNFMADLRKGLAEAKGTDAGIISGAVKAAVTKQVYGNLTDKQQAIASNIQEFINIKNQLRHGSTLSLTEQAVATIANSLDTVVGLKQMVGREINANLSYVKGITQIGDQSPEMKMLFDGALGSDRKELQDYQAGVAAEAELAKQAK